MKKEHTSTLKNLQSMSKSDGSWKHQNIPAFTKSLSLQNVNVGYYMKEDFKVLQHIQLTKRKKEKVTIDSLHTISQDTLISKALRCAPVGHLLGTDKRRVVIKSSFVSRLFFCYMFLWHIRINLNWVLQKNNSGEAQPKKKKKSIQQRV